RDLDRLRLHDDQVAAVHHSSRTRGGTPISSTAAIYAGFLLALIVTTAISTFVPALGTYHEFGLSVRDFPHFNPGVYESQLIDLPLIRNGSMRALDLGAMTGIVTFPSFHAASAAIYLWA